MAMFNVLASFEDEAQAERAVRRLEESGLRKDNVYVLHPGLNHNADRMSEMRAEMRDEVTEGFGGPALGFMTPDQAKGAAGGTIVGTIVGGLIGVAIGVAWAFLGHTTIGPVARFLFAFIPFAVAGAIVGAIAGGAFKPRAEAERHSIHFDDPALAAERDTIVAVHVNDVHAAERAQHVLEELGAERVDAVNADGTPLPPQSEHPRPADPPGRWWWPGGAKG